MKIYFLLFAGLLFLSGCTFSKTAKIDRLFQNYSGNCPGASVMVIQKGQPVLIKSYGMANLEKQIPLTPETNFRLASVTKQFTAMSIMLLVKENQLHLADQLTDIFPDFPDYGKKITIQHLLQHTSGLIDYENLIPDSATKQVHDDDVLTMMKSVDSTYFQPGTEHRYSNSAYAVLVMIIEKLSGLSYPEFLQKNIFTPLEMNTSIAFVDGKNEVLHRAFGYHVAGDSIQFSDQSITSAVLGDGGIYSSVKDLYKWDQALYKNELLPENLFEKAITPGINGYGFGWRIDEFEGHFRMSHTGSTCGFRNVIQRYPNEKLTIIILTNRREPDAEPLSSEIAKLYL
jgi:CubicO group peptidase (beta-lactamase class C family)